MRILFIFVTVLSLTSHAQAYMGVAHTSEAKVWEESFEDYDPSYMALEHRMAYLSSFFGGCEVDASEELLLDNELWNETLVLIHKFGKSRMPMERVSVEETDQDQSTMVLEGDLVMLSISRPKARQTSVGTFKRRY